MTQWPGRPVAPRDMPQNLIKQYEVYSFTEVEPRRAWCYDSVDEWFAVTGRVVGAMEHALHGVGVDPGLRAQEQETIDKMHVCWRAKGMGTLIETEEEHVHDPGQAAALETTLARRGRTYRTIVERMHSDDVHAICEGAGVPIARGKGAPFFFSGNDQDTAAAIFQLSKNCRTAEEAYRIISEAGGGVLPACSTSYLRIQGARKPQPYWLLGADGLYRIGDRYGPKTRPVNAVPFCWNVHLTVAGEMLTWCRKLASDRNSGTIHEAIAYFYTFKHRIASDLAGFDKSVGLETTMAWHRLILSPVLSALVARQAITKQAASLALSIHEAIQTLPKLLPPSSPGEGARIVPSSGTIRSGSRTTSAEGTDIRGCSIEAKAARLGLDVYYVNQGDDTVIYSHDSRLRDRWFDADIDGVKSSDMFGLKEEPTSDISYLQKRIPYGYAYLSRMVNGTVNREGAKEPKNVWAAASAMRIRHSLLDGHPCQTEFFPILHGANDRCRDSIALAKATPMFDLLDAAVQLSGSVETSRGESLAQHVALVNDARSQDLISQTEGAELLARLTQMTGRSTMSLNELRTRGAEMGDDFSRNLISDKSYTRRRK
jgi:hypothetical protein